MIQLYHADMSTCAQKVRLVLEQKKLAWNSHLLNLRHRDQHAPEYLKLNPNGVVPTLIDHDNVIIESTVICEYLDDAYPESSLVPDAPEHKALMRQWTKWLDEFLHFHTGVLSGSIAFRFQHLERPKDELEAYLRGIPDPIRRERQRQQIELGLEAPQFKEAVFAFETFLEKLETQLKKTKWMAGNTYSLADVGYTPYVIRLHELELQKWMSNRPKIQAWFEKIKKQPNYTKAYLDWKNQAYCNLMAEKGVESWTRIEKILSENLNN